MDLPEILLRHTVTVEPYRGTESWGQPTYAAAYEVACFVDNKRRLVRAADGHEVVSETTVYAPLDTDCPVDSRVTLASDGRQARVLDVKRRDGGGMPTPDHLEIVLI